MRKPYIGITGFINQSEVASLLDDDPPLNNHLLMIGVLLSWKTMRGLQNRWPNRYPEAENIASIFPNDKRTFNVIHFNTKDRVDFSLADQLKMITDVGGPHLHGLQLNIAWPPLSDLTEYFCDYPGTKIILQVGGHAFGLVENSPQKLAEKVFEYKGLIDYVLLDRSGGFGKPLNTAEMKDCLRALKDKDLKIGLGVAGGLSPTTFHLVEPLFDEFPDLSVDVETGVRDENDNLDLSLAKNFLKTFLNIF